MFYSQHHLTHFFKLKYYVFIDKEVCILQYKVKVYQWHVILIFESYHLKLFQRILLDNKENNIDNLSVTQNKLTIKSGLYKRRPQGRMRPPDYTDVVLKGITKRIILNTYASKSENIAFINVLILYMQQICKPAISIGTSFCNKS